ncbi:MAG: tol-pal system protein YbgF [Rhodocyclaceae bacterium]|nr:MAG: tol-pal system protein YbgF [Rhodocyclaceae bacterium]TND03101.1 MAG: tol-pal system protein YbgF [Rhodocyclaceae bacterium]
MTRSLALRAAALLPALLLAATLALPARAGMFDDEEARRQIEQLREQLRTEVADLAKRTDTVSRNQIDFANQIEAIKSDIAKLRGQIEVLTYGLEAAQKRQQDFYVDLDNRLRKLEKPPADAKAEPAKADPAQETRDYEIALAALKAAKFKEAAASFVAFIKTYPNGSLAASAHYWGAYAQAQAKDHAAAAELFGKFAAGWPTDDRAPAALESRIASLEAGKDWKGVRATLEQLAERYPNSDAGKRAKLRLKKK